MSIALCLSSIVPYHPSCGEIDWKERLEPLLARLLPLLAWTIPYSTDGLSDCVGLVNPSPIFGSV